ncbi:MAG: hypothetical protein ACOCZ6_03675 [Nanoarchaeota archaeon]
MKARFKVEREEFDLDIFIMMILLIALTFFLISSQDEQKENKPEEIIIKSSLNKSVNSVQSIEEGINYCKKTKNVDECLLRVSTRLNETKGCDPINDTITSDMCYMHFLSQEKFEVCENIHNPHIRNGCFTLKELEHVRT